MPRDVAKPVSTVSARRTSRIVASWNGYHGLINRANSRRCARTISGHHDAGRHHPSATKSTLLKADARVVEERQDRTRSRLEKGPTKGRQALTVCSAIGPATAPTRDGPNSSSTGGSEHPYASAQASTTHIYGTDVPSVSTPRWTYANLRSSTASHHRRQPQPT